MEILGYIASVIIGISLGLIGGGGSILTVPVLVYLFNIPPITATAYSLFIVGITSFVGVFPKYKQDLISIKTAIIFGIPSVITVFMTRKFILPAIPEQLFVVAEFEITRSLLMLVLFAVLMIVAAISMIRSEPCIDCDDDIQKFNYPLILAEGIVVGLLTGLVGAGGGFLIIPALVILSRLPIKKAVGTSLLIIAVKSVAGFTGDVLTVPENINWIFLLVITALAVIGIYIGNILSKKIDGERLKRGFGWSVLIMGIYIIIKETMLR